MPCHASWNAGATLDQAKPVNLDPDADEGRKVEHEFLGLRRLDDGRLEDAVFLGAAEGAAGSQNGPQSRTGLLVLTVSNRLNQINQLRGTGLINQI